MRKLLIIGLFVIPLMAPAQRRMAAESSFGTTVSLPWVNSFAFYDYELSKSTNRTGFMGFAASLYYKTDNIKYSASLGVLASNSSPMGNHGKDLELGTDMSATYVEGTLHKRVAPRVNLIAGLNFVSYEYSHYPDSLRSTHAIDDTGGLTTGVEYLIGPRKNFSLALFYRPTLIKFSGMKYKHIISFDARFDLDISRFF